MSDNTHKAVIAVAGKSLLISYFMMFVSALSDGTTANITLAVGVVTGLFAVCVAIAAATVLALDDINNNDNR